MNTHEAHHLLVPAGFYVLVKRFSSKEEPRRIVAAVYDPNLVPASMVGFENHLNYFHQRGKGIPQELAKGLAAFLNSTVVDQYFRQFSGHTQVNVADLKSLKYPSKEKLISLGSKINGMSSHQNDLDRLVNDEIKIILDPDKYSFC
jgi:adenine-specific DNA-methyltransferase